MLTPTQECEPKLNQCPTCRDRHTDCRSLIAEKLLESTLKDTPVPCRHHTNGCQYEELVVNLLDHEAGCMFRSVKCPASHRGACNWMGPLNKLIQHVIQQKCAQVAGNDRSEHTQTLFPQISAPQFCRF